MAEFEIKEKSGVLFFNKSDNPQAPTLTCRGFLFEGKEYRLALWEKEGAKGKFYSFKITEARKKEETNE
jgi:hypothetical protein